jgi:hypothetical protein
LPNESGDQSSLAKKKTAYQKKSHFWLAQSELPMIGVSGQNLAQSE